MIYFKILNQSKKKIVHLHFSPSFTFKIFEKQYFKITIITFVNKGGIN